MIVPKTLRGLIIALAKLKSNWIPVSITIIVPFNFGNEVSNDYKAKNVVKCVKK